MRDPLLDPDGARPSALSSRDPILPARLPRDVADPADGRLGMVDERLAALAIRRVLDQGAERLPHRVSERLAAARSKAVGQVAEVVPARPAARPLPPDERPVLRWRLAAAGLSLAILVAVSVLVDSVQEAQSVEEMAEVNNALLTDDLPLDAYADRGFGVYLVNTRLPQAQAMSVSLRR